MPNLALDVRGAGLYGARCGEGVKLFLALGISQCSGRAFEPALIVIEVARQADSTA